jgi:glycosyltransferase involved in cell wall biosynthesis
MANPSRVKVLHIITRLDPGGSSTNTIETTARLDPERYETHLLAGRTHDPGGTIEQAMQFRGVRYVFEPSLQREIHPVKDMIAFFRLYRFIKKGKYAIVHTHSSKAGIIGRWAAWLAGVPVIVHTPHGHVFYGYFDRFRSGVFVIIERFTAKITRRIITLTEQGRKDHIELKIADSGKFIVIPSGIDITALQRPPASVDTLRQGLGWTNGELVFGTVTRLDPVKGNVHLIRAMARVLARFPNARCLIVGEGEERQALVDLSRSLNIDQQICFAGFQPDVPAYLQAMDIYVQPSLNEGMGRAILEAMASGLPVIASRVGGIPDVVEDGRTGRLVAAEDDEDLARAMIALGEDADLAADMARQGKARVDEAFGLPYMVQQIDKLYQTLTQKDLA